MRRRFALGLMLAALGLASHACWIHAKGQLGQWLMARSWADAERKGDDVEPPWPGARTRPVARLVVPELKIDRLVIDGIDLPNLAWGPGLTEGAFGHRVIAGHRDTHFRFLGDLQRGDALELRFPDRPTAHWRVEDARVVDSRLRALDIDAAGPQLTLVTCYPLESGPAGTPYRLVVSAFPADREATSWVR